MTDEIDSETWPACLGSGEVGTYEVQRAEDGTIAFVLAGEPCGGGARGKVLTGSFELVS